MRLTIIPSDGTIGVNNSFFSGLDLTACGIPQNIHALQWYESEGEVEFIDNPDRSKPPNEIITELPAWVSNVVITFNTAKSIQEAERTLVQVTQPQTTGTQPA